MSLKSRQLANTRLTPTLPTISMPRLPSPSALPSLILQSRAVCAAFVLNNSDISNLLAHYMHNRL